MCRVNEIRRDSIRLASLPTSRDASDVVRRMSPDELNPYQADQGGLRTGGTSSSSYTSSWWRVLKLVASIARRLAVLVGGLRSGGCRN
ncbi:hypothetical protein KC359_g21 [Hortaea werneckii]|nr:hypothetical protein KC359_g21 [Hortaea werneckii]